MPRAEKSPSTDRSRKSRPGRPAPELPPDLPPWLPSGDAWARLPQEIREPALRLLPPAYRHFVLDAPDDLQRSVGEALVTLTWMELCGQVRLAQLLADPDSVVAILEDPDELTARHLRLVKAKCRSATLLVRMKAVLACQPPNVISPLPQAGEGPGVRAASAGSRASIAPTQPSPQASAETERFPASALDSLNPRLENRPVDDQLDHPALTLIAARPELFCRQGNIAATYRRRNGKTFGPYYRLSYREDGRQRSIYLGRSGPLVEQVRRTLAAHQQPITQHRLCERLMGQVRASLRVEKLRVRALLCPFGLRLKGFEVRGWRFSPLRWLLPRRRRLAPPFAMRIPRLRPRPNDDPASRLHRYLAARDGYVPCDDDATLTFAGIQRICPKRC
jgi:hypothetical protein